MSHRFDRRILIICSVLLLTLGSRMWLNAEPPHPSRLELSAFPRQMGEWQTVNDTLLTEDVSSVLKADDYLLRDFRRADGTAANLFVAYYKTQHAGEAMHSPKNCLPGSGWTPTLSDTVVLDKINGKDVRVNRYVIEKDRSRALAIYWYQEGGRVISNEYAGKIFLVWDALRTGRRDGAIVRVVLPLENDHSLDETTDRALALARAAEPVLPQFVPN